MDEDRILSMACEIILQLPHLVRYFYFDDLKRLRREGEICKNKTSIEIWSRLARYWLECGEFDAHCKYGYSGGSYFPLISEFINKQKEITCEIK